ncbi:MAG: phosphoribosylformylglycinamidine synthase subunit PurQ [Capsulimonadaceae bacterium]
MKFAVVRFPGSNCDQDAYYTIKDVLRQPVEYLWHKQGNISGVDVVVIPGGFSFGDYLRCGAIARFSPVMQAVQDFAARGGLVIGICNGFQILCESHLLPGALVRNDGQRFICRHVHLRTENNSTPYTNRLSPAQVLRIPIAHGEGKYVCDDSTLDELERTGRVLFRYCDTEGRATVEANPNGSRDNIAGIANATFNVFGLMPHPERAADSALGSADGRYILESILARAV